MLCAVCTVHVEMRSAGFLAEPQNQGQWFVSGLRFGLKTTRTVFSGLASKPVVMVFSGFGLKTGGDGFSRFGLKTCGVVGFLVEPPNQGGGGFFSLGLKTGSYGLLIWASKSP
jgi:hypothetical protein